MSKYKEWMSKQSEEFKKEILSDNILGEKFFDYNDRPISNEELEELDNEFIFKEL